MRGGQDVQLFLQVGVAFICGRANSFQLIGSGRLVEENQMAICQL